MILSRRTSLALTLTFALTVSAWAQNDTALPTGSSPLTIVQTDEIVFPRTLRKSGVDHGEAWVALNVDAAGHLQDLLVTAYTRREFADEAAAALKRWRFRPAVLHGEPVATVREVHFIFSLAGVRVENLSGIDMIARYLDRPNKERLVYRVSALRELDDIPVPVRVVQPSFPAALHDKGVSGTITVEFYIDDAGHVRLPAVTDWNQPELANLALDAVREWQFETPLQKGRPAVVLARQKFIFSQ